MKNFYQTFSTFLKVAVFASLTSMSFGQCMFTGAPYPDIVVDALPGDCGAFVTFDPPPTDMNCGVNQSHTSGFFPIGTTVVTFTTTGAPSDSETYNIVVNDYPTPVSSISCNDLVNISLDTDCTRVVGAGQLLQGGPYSCFDNYTVDILDEFGVGMGNVLDASHINQSFEVIVTDQNSNSCMSNIFVEDKQPVVLDCQDINTSCHGSTDPGAPITEQVILVSQTVTQIDAGAAGDAVRNFEVFGLVGSTITDLDIEINIDHTNVGQLSATLQSPAGTMINLFDLTGTGCTEDNLSFTLNDAATNSYADLQSTCDNTGIAISGEYVGQDLISVFNGEDPNGTWQLVINDNAAGDGGQINDIVFTFQQSNGVVAFPGPLNASYIQTADNMYAVSGQDACGSSSLGFIDEIETLPCSSIYSEIITRTWSAMDAQGNVSSKCDQIIYVYRNDLRSLTWPSHYDNIDLPALSCLQWGETVPPPSVTGMPTGLFCENITVLPHDDQKIDVCEKSYKVIRTWRVIDHCESGVEYRFEQIIKVEDVDGPVITCPQDVTIVSDDYSCSGTYNVPPPIVTTECSDETSYEVAYLLADGSGDAPIDGVYIADNVSGPIGGPYTIDDLPLGRTWLRYRVFDNCGNFMDCYTEVTVEDRTLPTPVCEQHTATSIDEIGWAEVFATTFDDFSHDNCAIDYWEARKMTNKCSQTDLSFGPSVLFCCEEVGDTIMVEFRVWDVAGNNNSCMVEVVVQDKIPPHITCPNDVTLDCHADVDDISLTGQPIVIDNCLVTGLTYTDSGALDQCGEGVITRTWVVEDHVGLKDQCVQMIDVVDRDPFDENDITWPIDYEDDNACLPDLSPENLAAIYLPRIDDDECSLATLADHVDEYFPIAEGSCHKILRRWTVIDWCTYDPNIANTGIWRYTQELKIKNVSPPQIEDCNDIVICSYEEGCVGSATLSINATDDCTAPSGLEYTYEIFDDQNDFVTSGTTSSVTRTFATGIYRIFWTVADGCGNFTECDYQFTIKDCKKPTPYCITSLTTAVMDQSGSVQIWAKDYDFGSYDNCTEQQNLRFTFSQVLPQADIRYLEDERSSFMTFDCSQILDGVSHVVEIEIWVFDEENNSESCRVQIVLQDNNADACEDQASGMSFVTGYIETDQEKRVEDVEVSIRNEADNYVEFWDTDRDGDYIFDNLANNDTYHLNAYKDDAPLNGVTTLDLLFIQKHIIGVELLDSPYRIIASDIDNNQRISATDLSYLRKMILGVYDEFSNEQKSWRFVDAAYEFDYNLEPFPFKESISISGLSSNHTEMDFMAVKIGDVNGNVVASSVNAELDTESRNEDALVFYTDEVIFTKGDNVLIPVYANNFEDILAFQHTIAFNPNKLNFTSIEGESIALNQDNLGLTHLDKGMIAMSWFDLDGLSIDDDKPLFYMNFEAIEDGYLSEKFEINSEVTKSESYTSDYTAQASYLTVRNSNVSSNKNGFALFQNTPNPFNNSTQISFYLPNAADATITIFDISGKLVWTSQGSFNEGLNKVDVNGSELMSSGLMYYTLQTDKYTATRKMIMLK